ncbi:hypothetical protein U1Q18_027209 [Sarracenia purpurea var. burkii]
MLLLYGVAEKWSVVRGVFGLEHMVFPPVTSFSICPSLFTSACIRACAPSPGFGSQKIFGPFCPRFLCRYIDARENPAPEYREAFGARFEQEHESVVVRVHAEWETGRNASRNEGSALAVGDEVPDRRRGDERAVLSSPRLFVRLLRSKKEQIRFRALEPRRYDAADRPILVTGPLVEAPTWSLLGKLRTW